VEREEGSYATRRKTTFTEQDKEGHAIAKREFGSEATREKLPAPPENHIEGWRRKEPGKTSIGRREEHPKKLSNSSPGEASWDQVCWLATQEKYPRGGGRKVSEERRKTPVARAVADKNALSPEKKERGVIVTVWRSRRVKWLEEGGKRKGRNKPSFTLLGNRWTKVQPEEKKRSNLGKKREKNLAGSSGALLVKREGGRRHILECLHTGVKKTMCRKDEKRPPARKNTRSWKRRESHLSGR